ncbi:MAG: reverse transcriptase [Bacteroides sp.]|nr:reverse transcriptase [Bacteroides sp.]
MERIANIDNLRLADRKAQEGKTKRIIIVNGKEVRIPNKYIQKHNENAEKELRDLQKMILTLTFPPPNYRSEFLKTDAGKVRELIKQNYYPWRILQHAIMLVVSPRIFGSLITDTFACVKGKGLHFGVRRIKRTMRRHPELKWFWKTDFKKYYQSLPHELVRSSLKRLFKDKTFIRLIDIVVLAYDSGIEVIKELENEIIRNQRNPYWGRVKPDIRKSRNKPHRPSDETRR